MKNLLLILSLFLLFACNQQEHFLKDKAYRKQVSEKFEKRKSIMQNRKAELLSVFNEELSLKEKEAMMFLYAFMPLNDLMDYDAEFHLKQVRYAFKAREAFPWGKEITDADFRHFVLPYRVNNENLDTARMVFFHELRERVKGMSMKEAALEINHWCHEKVTYVGSDIRTSAPLATVKNAKGRCGEESTFSVAAYRAAGIPARQCYTPRWAHCDDNHAWVEIFVDGKWQYTGACEPEADLNQGWFTQPAQKAMLVHTKVFGKYNGYEKATYHTENYSELNLLEKYTKTAEIEISVKDAEGNSVENAEVQYSVLNYGEFYPLVTKKTNAEGLSTFTTGLGSLLIWVSKEDQFAFEKIDISKEKKLEIVLGRKEDYLAQDFYYELDPSEYEDTTKFAKPNEENNKRLQEEDKIRKAYENTFIGTEGIKKFAKAQQLDVQKMEKILKASRGNYEEIMNFIKACPQDKRDLIFPLLETVSNKDLHDTSASVLLDHINHCSISEYDTDIFNEYILNPRVKNEILSAYRSFIQSELKGKVEENPMAIKQWIISNVKISAKENFYRTPITPIGVIKGRYADEKSRNILFVAICRSFGIPARIEPASLQVQYFNNNKWQFVYFEDIQKTQKEMGYISLHKASANADLDPEYFKNFTIAKLENGKLSTLEFDFMKKLSAFESKIPVQVGTYVLTTANRKPNGGVLTKRSFFEVKADQDSKLEVEVLKAIFKEEVLAQIDLNQELLGENDKQKIVPAALGEGKNMVIAWLAPDKEPTKHALVEFSALKKEYEELGAPILFSIPKEKQTASFHKEDYQLPEQCTFVTDSKLLLELEEKSGQKLHEEYPVFAIVKANGDVVYLNKGYKIDLGKQILNILKEINTTGKSCHFTK